MRWIKKCVFKLFKEIFLHIFNSNFLKVFEKYLVLLYIMSTDNENVSATNLEKLDELTNKLNRCNKNIKLVLELLEKMSKANESKTEYKPMDETTYKNKRAVYLTKFK